LSCSVLQCIVFPCFRCVVVGVSVGVGVGVGIGVGVGVVVGIGVCVWVAAAGLLVRRLGCVTVTDVLRLVERGKPSCRDVPIKCVARHLATTGSQSGGCGSAVIRWGGSHRGAGGGEEGVLREEVRNCLADLCSAAVSPLLHSCQRDFLPPGDLHCITVSKGPHHPVCVPVKS